MDEKIPNSSLLSAKNLSFIVLFFAIVVSAYLSYLKINTSAHAVCVPGEIFDCGTVLNSVYSEVMDIPIAWLGLGVNLLVVILLSLESRIAFLKQYSVPIIFGVLLFAFLFSVYLVYVQAVLITKFCPWCLSHEAMVTIVFGLSVARLMNWMDSEELVTE